MRVQRDTYHPKGGATHAERWRVFVHYRSPAGELVRKSFLAPDGASKALAHSAGLRMLATMEAADDAATREALRLARGLRADNQGERPTEPTHTTKPTTPTVAEFSKRYLAEFCEANRQAWATLARKQGIFANYVVPLLGHVPLGALTGEHVQQIKAALGEQAPRSVNTVLGAFRAMLRVAADWKIIPSAPAVRMLPIPEDEPDWYEPDEYDALCSAAATMDPRINALVLLGGDAGLRRGEMMALKWADVRFDQNVIVIKASRNRKGEKSTKNGKIRRVNMTARLRSALEECAASSGGRTHVLWTDVRRTYAKGRQPLIPGLPAETTLRDWLIKVEDKADVPAKHLHALRHTFCSNLGRANVDPRTIMKLSGHATLAMVLRYTHAVATAPAAGIEALENAQRQRAMSTIRAKTPEHPSYLQ